MAREERWLIPRLGSSAELIDDKQRLDEAEARVWLRGCFREVTSKLSVKKICVKVRRDIVLISNGLKW